MRIQTENFMIDIETMGQTANAAILSIGMVRFDINNGVTDTFYSRVDLQSCIDQGLSIDASTIKWWLKQEDDARAEITLDAPRLIDVLIKLSNWLYDACEHPVIWGNGSDFDNTILANAHQKCGLPLPWKYYNNRCYQTVKNLFPNISMNRIGTHHNALDDAESQALHLIEILQQPPPETTA